MNKINKQTSLPQQRLSPSPLLYEVGGYGREHEGADSGAADGNSGSQSPPLLEVEPGRYHRRHVDQTGADASCTE